MSFNCIIATPSTGQCRHVYATSLARLTAYFASVRVFPEVPEQALDFDGVEGSGVGSNRDRLVERALAKPDMTHLCFIDEDMAFAPDVLHVLARRRHPIVGVNYRMRVPPAPFTALDLARTARIETTKDTSGLEEATYMGFGFCLIERKVLEAVPVPRFLATYTDHYTTEDMPFFVAARKAGFPCYVDHDASKGVLHRGDWSYRWDEDYSAFGVTDGKRS